MLRKYDHIVAVAFRRYATLAPASVGEVNLVINAQEMGLRQLSGSDSLHRSSCLQALGALFALRFESFGVGNDIGDLDKATTCHRSAIELLPDDNPAKAAYLACLGLLSWARFDRSDELGDLENAVASWAHAVQLITGLRRGHTATLSLAFLARFDDARQSGVLQQAIAALRRKPNVPGREKARSKIPKLRHLLALPIKPGEVLDEIFQFEKSLLSYLGRRSVWIPSSDDLNDAIAATSCVAALAVDMDMDVFHASALYNLSAFLARRFHQNRSRSDLYDAIDHLDHAYPALDPVFAQELHTFLGSTIVIQEGLFGLPEGETLSRCCRLVPMAHRLAERLPEGDTHLKARCLCGVGSLYIGRFEKCGGGHDDLDNAVVVHRAAVQLSETSLPLHRLCGALKLRYLHFGADADLHEAVELARRLVLLASNDSDIDSPLLADMYDNLAFLCEWRSKELPDSCDAAGDAVAAAEARRHATALDPVHFPSADSEIPEKPLGTISWPTPVLDSLLESRALEIDTDQVGTCIQYLSLGRHAARRYTDSRQPSDRERALTAYRDAIDLAPSLYRLAILNEFCTKLADWDQRPQAASRTHVPRTLEQLRSHIPRLETLRERILINAEALECRGSVHQEYLALMARLHICGEFRWAVPFSEHPEVDYGIVDVDKDEIVTCQRILDIIPRLASEGFSISRRYREMARLSSIVHIIVWTAAMRGDPIALRFFEQGRSLVWGQIRNLRTRIDLKPSMCSEQLAPAYKRYSDDSDAGTELQELGDELERVSKALEVASQNEDSVTARTLGRQREALLDRIRSIDGFEDFLQPKSLIELSLACEAGPIVCINLCNGIAHAIILYPRSRTPSTQEDMFEVKIFLLKLIPTSIERWRQRWNSCLGRKSRPAVTAVRDPSDTISVLRELWDLIVNPVLGALKICSDEFPADGANIPRITWCTTGALASLPLHAAGPYDSISPNASDLFVSSYTPSISILLLRSRSGALTASPNILVVAQPTIAGFSSLPGTLHEADAVQSLFRDSCVRLDDAQGTVERVFAELSTHNYVHLACHGEQDPDNPLKSSFMLHDGRLTLERLMDLAHSSVSPIGQLAFLSACETATGDEKVPDEAVHLAAGMLAVGYRSVVATMWSIGDEHAAQVAGKFYEIIMGQPAGKKDVARALHAAVAALRKEVGDDRVASWAPFVHYGV